MSAPGERPATPHEHKASGGQVPCMHRKEFLCTRPFGHSGDHIAHRIEPEGGIYDRWPDDLPEVPTPSGEPKARPLNEQERNEARGIEVMRRELAGGESVAPTPRATTGESNPAYDAFREWWLKRGAELKAEANAIASDPTERMAWYAFTAAWHSERPVAPTSAPTREEVEKRLVEIFTPLAMHEHCDECNHLRHDAQTEVRALFDRAASPKWDRELRAMWAMGHGCEGIYGDDGKLQCKHADWSEGTMDERFLLFVSIQSQRARALPVTDAPTRLSEAEIALLRRAADRLADYVERVEGKLTRGELSTTGEATLEDADRLDELASQRRVLDTSEDTVRLNWLESDANGRMTTYWNQPKKVREFIDAAMQQTGQETK